MKTNLFKTFQPFINRCKKSALPNCGFVKVENGTATITDCETWVEFNTDLPDGMYNVINGETFKSTADPEEFPVLTLGKQKASGVLNPDDILALAPCKSDDQLRPVMNGIHLTNDNLAASDAHVLRWIERNPSDTLDGTNFNDIFIPTIPLLSLLKAADIEPVSVHTFYPDENPESPDTFAKYIKFCFTGCYITQRLVEGNYPNWKGIIPSYRNMQAAMVLQPTVLTDIVKTVKAFKGSFLTRVTETRMVHENLDLELKKEWPVQFCEVPERAPDALVMPMMIEGDGILGMNPLFIDRARTLFHGNIILGWEQCSGVVSRPMLVWFERKSDNTILLDKYQLPVAETKKQEKPEPEPEPETSAAIPEPVEAEPESLPEPSPAAIPEPVEGEPVEVPEPEQKPSESIPEYIPAPPTENDGHCEGETTEATPLPSESSPQSAITILSYSPRSIIVVGPTKQFKEAFKAAWGRWSVNLKHPETGQVTKGWVFSNKRKAQIEQILNAA